MSGSVVVMWGDVWVQRGCGVMYEAMVMWEWSGDSGCSVDVG